MKDNFKEALVEAGVNVEDAVERCCGKEELFEKLLKIFFKNPDEMDKLAAKVENKDYEELFSQSHALKGAAGGIGLTQLYQNFCALVESLRAKNYDPVEEQAKAVIEEYHKIEQIVLHYTEE